MSVLMVMEVPGATTAQYDRVNELMGIHSDADEPDALLQHVAASDGSSLVVVDVWESEEEMGKFFEERLGAALAEAGLQSDSKPLVLPVHNSLNGKGADARVLMMIEIEELGPDAYDQMVASMDAHVADGSNHPSTSHTAAGTEGGGMLVADLWESPEAFGKFAEEQIGPAGAAVGLGPIEPRLIPIHKSYIKARAAQPAS